MVFKKKKGFTLVELLVCLFIIALMMLLIVPNIASQREKAQQTSDQAIIKLVESQKELYKLDHHVTTDPSVEELKKEKYLNEEQVKAYNKADKGKKP